MAKPVTLAALAAEIRRLDPTIKVKAKNLPGRPGNFNPIGITIHITAGGLNGRTHDQYDRDILISDPSTPLKANASNTHAGDINLLTAGRSNHILYYSSKALRACRDASFPLSGTANYRGSLMRMSDHAYGIEMIAPSGSAVTAKQRHSAVVWAAAICRLHGWTGQEVHGHGEVAYDRGPSDPGINMGTFRRDVMALVKSGTTGSTPSTPTAPKETHPMAGLNSNDEKVLVRAMETALKNRLTGDIIPVDPNNKDNPDWTLASVEANSYRRTVEIRDELRGLRRDIQALVHALGATR